MRRTVRRVLGAIAVGALLLGTMTACVEGTVIRNTNPKGEDGKLCKLTIRVANRDGGESSKEFEQDNATCRRCQVGAAFPKCKKESGDRVTNREETKQEKPLVIRVLASSTSPGLSITVFVHNKDDKAPNPKYAPTFHEPTRDRSQTVFLVQSDRRIRAHVAAKDKNAIVSCKILGTAREEWASNSGGGGSVWCETHIASRFR